jgi:hypothetical protein
MDEYPLVKGRNKCYYRHTGAGEVLLIGYVIYDWAPGF